MQDITEQLRKEVSALEDRKEELQARLTKIKDIFLHNTNENNLLECLGDIAGAEIVYIAKRTADHKLKIVKATSSEALHITYSSIESPCEMVLTEKRVVSVEDLAERFPWYSNFFSNRMEYYIGTPLLDEDCNPFGVIGLLSSDRMECSDLLETSLYLNAERISSKMVKQYAAEEAENWEQAYQQLAESVRDPVMIHQDGKFVYVNNAALNLLNASDKSEVIGREVLSYSHQDDIQKAKRRMDVNELENGKITSEEFHSVDDQNNSVKVKTMRSRIIYNGSPAVQVVVLNRTEKEKFRTALEDTETRLLTLINNTPDVIILKDNKGRWLEANDTCEEIFGLQKEAYKGLIDKEIFQVNDELDLLKQCETSDRAAWDKMEPSRSEEVFQSPDKSPRIFDVYKIPLFYPDGSKRGLVIIGRDITERKKTEQILAESEQRYKSLVDQNPDAILSISTEGIILDANEMAEHLTGYSQAELVNQSYEELIDDEHRTTIKENFLRAINGEALMDEIKIINKNGQFIHLNIKCVPIIVKGTCVGIYVIGQDITYQKQNEEMIRRSEKLSVVGQLAAGVAHEIRNPLTSLKGFLQLMKADTENNEARYKDKEYIEIMLAELNRINFIVSEFMVLSKPQELHVQNKNVVLLLKEVLAILDTQAILKNIRLLTEIQGNLPTISCEPNQIKQVFINILKNAMEAMNAGGEITIAVTQCEERYICIDVTDQGPGIPEDRLKKIGEPFYTTKEKGTGLGLMVSNKIIQNHKGTISYESEIGKGTTVKIKLPIMQ
ncbi:PAS domain S-box protein [Pseudalkalibacillus caeni]|uniref:histidine kinase n=1 Tax=Exobacillus caeni TaxID=2574798 RepID=A0A5R9EYE6_9BACL|nr:PAS domain S-box protein [Pseudalkalibacillus caeni]TLS35080.1 PAS domain S-box protein [Pseudalkalibacillus caeni]